MLSYIYSRMRIVLLALSLLFSSLSSTSQVKVTIFGADSLPFLFAIDQNAINQVACTEITVPFQTIGKHILQATLPGNIVLQQNITWKSPGTYVYEIKEVKGALKIALNSESLLTAVSSPSPLPAPVPVVLDSLPTPAPPVYSGVIGCPEPLSDTVFDELIKTSHAQSFESRRTTWWITQLSSQCLKVDQLNAVLSDVELEENRLQLLENLVGNIYDRDHLTNLIPLFLLEKNKFKAQAMISR